MSGGCARRGNCPVAANRNAPRVERDGEKWRRRRKQRGVAAENSERGERGGKRIQFLRRDRGGLAFGNAIAAGCNYYVLAESDRFFAVTSAVSPKLLCVAIESDRNRALPLRLYRESQCALAWEREFLSQVYFYLQLRKLILISMVITVTKSRCVSIDKLKNLWDSLSWQLRQLRFKGIL